MYFVTTLASAPVNVTSIYVLITRPADSIGFLIWAVILTAVLFYLMCSHRIDVDEDGFSISQPFSRKVRMSWREVRDIRQNPGVGPRAHEIDGPLATLFVAGQAKGITINSRVFSDKDLTEFLEMFRERAA